MPFSVILANQKSTVMFFLFRQDPIKKLEKQYLQLMEQARDIQRSGDLRAYSKKILEAEELQHKIDLEIAAKYKK